MFFKTSTVALSLGALFPTVIQARPNCPLLGPDFPAAKNLSSSLSIKNAITNLTQTLDQTIKSGNSRYGPFETLNTSFALEIFSTSESQPLFTKYYTAPSVASHKAGTKGVDTNTIFRIGSLTKLLTAYTWLIHDTDIKFTSPITKFLPELAAAAEKYNATEHPIDYVSWEDITIGELFSHTAGLGRDYEGVGAIGSPFFSRPNANTAGLPPLDANQTGTCIGATFCTRALFFQGFTKRHPVYAPGQAAIYSNVAYLILAYALEDITGKPFTELVQTGLYTPLGLKSSSWRQPPGVSNTTGIIPDPMYFSIDAGDETAAGGSWSSPKDITTIGRSILTSSLLRPSLTRRWMKPMSLVSDPSTAVGAPWEIKRITLPKTGRIVDLYAKTGDFAGFSSILILVPDWNIGITLVAAGTKTTFNLAVLGSMVSDLFLPAVEDAAREEANENLTGTFSSTSKNLNSTLTLTTSPTLPGLILTTYISNSTNFLVSPTSATSIISSPSMRLYPTGLKQIKADGCTVLGFRVVDEDLEAPTVTGAFGVECSAWMMVDGLYWGTVGTDEFLVTVDKEGRTVSVEPRALRVVLERV
ncbi:beta-lactamase/transpeptidase-like protein [Tricladium varicosporioides]|nr:beta-lactamase/transpeptidase-like protein [Hymenoscyphus varicosporioides]